MDPLTHTLAGACLGATRLGRLAASAPVILVVGANLPDVDGLAYFWGSDTALAVRRGWTHGILAMALLPLMLAGAAFAWERWRTRGRGEGHVLPRFTVLLGLSTLGVWSHPALDWLNTYGVRLLAPFDQRWFYGDAVFIVDPWLWLVLGCGAFAVFSARRRSLALWLVVAAGAGAVLLVGTGSLLARGLWVGGVAFVAVARAVVPRLDLPHERRLFRRSPTSEALATASLAAAVLYVGALVATSAAGARIAARAVATGAGGTEPAPVLRAMAGPVRVDPTVRDLVVETPDAYRTGRLRWGLPWKGGTTIDWGASLPTGVPSAQAPLVERALEETEIQGFVGWMRFPFYRLEPPAEAGRAGNEVVVRIADARYARRAMDGFGGVRVTLPASAEAAASASAP